MNESTKSESQEKVPTDQDEMLKGTAVSVFVIGAIILILWFIVAYIYVMRF